MLMFGKKVTEHVTVGFKTKTNVLRFKNRFEAMDYIDKKCAEEKARIEGNGQFTKVFAEYGRTRLITSSRQEPEYTWFY